jgi:hypothetical protein
MAFNGFKASYLSYNNIRASAKSFLAKYNPKDEVPLNIEQADCFAGLILVLSAELKRQVKLNVQKLKDTGFTIRDDNYEMLIGYICNPIPKHFVILTK